MLCYTLFSIFPFLLTLSLSCTRLKGSVATETDTEIYYDATDGVDDVTDVGAFSSVEGLRVLSHHYAYLAEQEKKNKTKKGHKKGGKGEAKVSHTGD